MVQKILVLVLGIIGVLAVNTAFAANIYQVTDLGVLPGGVSSTATSVDSTGEVVGYTTFSNGSTQAFYWTQSGGMVAVGGTNSKAFGVNNGNVVGITGSAGQAFRWTQISGTTLLDPSNQGQANGVNASGEIVGSRNLTTINHRAVTWSSSNTLSNPFPLINLTGAAVNDLGHFVGVSNNVGGYYNDGLSSTRVNLGSFLPTSLSNTDLAGGAVSQIAAFENISTLTITSIGTLSGDATSNALGIDPLGTTVVGVSQGHGGFLYDISSSSLSRLTSLLDPSDSGWSILTGNAIANAPISGSAMIAGQGDFGGVQHAVLLTVPEPSSIILASLVFVSSFAIFHRRSVMHSNNDECS
ncbi:hypothetical protein K2Y11_09715 [bacterium]|nr:hypothetical protein [bacterium]